MEMKGIFMMGVVGLLTKIAGYHDVGIKLIRIRALLATCTVGHFGS